MDTTSTFNHTPPQNPNPQFPILVIAVLCILAIALLLVLYYLLLTKCCLTLQQIDPLRRLSFSRSPAVIPVSPFDTWHSPGLDQTLIGKLPTLQYSKTEGEQRSLFECAVCLTEFVEPDLLRVLPNCGHGFHIDCIDIWLQTSANCPICRSGISGRNRYPRDRIVAPTPSPNDEDYVAIELGENRGSEKQGRNWECHHGSMRVKDERFGIQPIRRSFSMDSAADREVYRAVREAIQEGNMGEGSSSSSSGRVKRLFSFGQGKSSVLPVEF